MLNLKSVGRVAIAGVCLVAIAVATSNKAEARKEYMDGFKAQYADLAKKEKITCSACHPTSKKAERNNYGTALAKALDATKVKDKELIKKAIIKIEEKDSAEEGKTFGDLIKDGKLPGTKDVVKK